MGEIWGVCYEHFGENLPCYNGTTVYILYIEVTRKVHWVKQYFIYFKLSNFEDAINV